MSSTFYIQLLHTNRLTIAVVWRRGPPARVRAGRPPAAPVVRRRGPSVPSVRTWRPSVSVPVAGRLVPFDFQPTKSGFTKIKKTKKNIIKNKTTSFPK